MHNDNDIKIMCKNIETIRKGCKLSYKEMADILDIPVLTLKKLESGIITRRANVEFVFRVEKAFHISAKDLFTKILKDIDFSFYLC